MKLDEAIKVDPDQADQGSSILEIDAQFFFMKYFPII